nr:reverse transcriptase domain-containing protein [Tanacetum cinerariifolium]
GAFKEMKQSIAELLMLTAPKEKEELIMYLAATKEAISAVLMTERNGKQVPIYFVIRALQGPEIKYTPMEKLIRALVSVSKRLKRYFQAHTIVVITDQPIKQLLSNPEVTRRLLKWRFKLGEHDIQYRPMTSVKGQIMEDFIVERLEDDTLDTPMEDREELPDPWILFTDESSCIDGSGAGLIITNPEGMEFTYALRFRINATNNEAEYEALIVGLQIAGQMRVQYLQANVDSKLVANQEKLTPITSPWPFYKWGIDIAEPFLEGLSKVKFLIVAMDYFNKWIETRPVATITGTQPWASAWISWRKRENMPQYKKQGTKPKWKDITTPGFEAPASVQETLSVGATKQAMQKMETSSDLSGRDRTKSRKHWAKEHTGLETIMDTPFREHGISTTLKSAICMKCKHPLHVKQSGRKDTDGILFVCNIFKFLMNEKVKPSYLHPF